MLAGRVVARRGADAVEWYRKMLAERPIAANALTCGTLYAAGDCIAQQLERIFGLQSPGKSGYNYRRTLRVFVGGACYAGPCMALWYPRLHLMTAPARRTLVPVPADTRAHPRLGPELYEKVPCTSPWKNVAAKIFLDNACDAASSARRVFFPRFARSVGSSRRRSSRATSLSSARSRGSARRRSRRR